VQVTGERYQPEGQAIMAVHVRVHTLALVDDDGSAELVGLGPERELRGRFEERLVPDGAKGAGERYVVFVADGAEHLLASEPPPGMTLLAPATIRAREATMSPYVARRGGPYLWVLELVN
jgi:hypothetical protein